MGPSAQPPVVPVRAGERQHVGGEGHQHAHLAGHVGHLRRQQQPGAARQRRRRRQQQQRHAPVHHRAHRQDGGVRGRLVR
eukprot:XP_001692002.1 predicted protein [Chlamydomonas reinhardtii]